MSLDVRAILLDIEGTTTPISFVYDVLFPYARAQVREFLEENLESAAVTDSLELLRSEYQAEQQEPLSLAFNSRDREQEISSFVEYVHWLMDRDRKSTGLKSLQGKIWELGYRNGVLKSQVFIDVFQAFKRWRESGKIIAIFSSGSVLAQKLLFAHTDYGDLTACIDHYFDTTVGPKNRMESYSAIVERMDIEAAETIFISDVITELDAAQASSMSTLLCVRPGNHPQPSSTHQVIHSFDEVA